MPSLWSGQRSVRCGGGAALRPHRSNMTKKKQKEKEKNQMVALVRFRTPVLSKGTAYRISSNDSAPRLRLRLSFWVKPCPREHADACGRHTPWRPARENLLKRTTVIRALGAVFARRWRAAYRAPATGGMPWKWTESPYARVG